MKDATLRRDPNVIVAELAGRPLLLNVVSWTYLSLNETGARIWEHLAEPCCRETLLRMLADEFDARKEELAADLDPFLGDLQAKGFLVPQ